MCVRSQIGTCNLCDETFEFLCAILCVYRTPFWQIAIVQFLKEQSLSTKQKSSTYGEMT